MKRINLIIGILVLMTTVFAGISTAHNASQQAENSITTLDSSNIDRYLTAGGIWFLKFYAPWCKHSKSFQPIFEELSILLKGQMNFGQIDCISDPALLHRFGIKAYPTIKLLYEGNMYEFRGERTLQSILVFLRSGFKEVYNTPYPYIQQPTLPTDTANAGQTNTNLDIKLNNNDKQHIYEDQDHDEEAERLEYEKYIEKEIAQKQKEADMKKIEEQKEKQQQRLARKVIDLEESVKPTTNNTRSSFQPILDSITDSKLSYAVFGGLITGCAFLIRKRFFKKNKFMKIA
ncbi:hypothetical protein CYY_006257 [Polysphondylium violaceum]|uniref:Thioredoxin domain-containing protein n=1 Tax=Polysphondylium violaceum TaxID=133409 RepID=A0A8J4V3B5_9MYCE|nr:hypothetical protein CYY_006257 [Polysphondylium violaceum]